MSPDELRLAADLAQLAYSVPVGTRELPTATLRVVHGIEHKGTDTQGYVGYSEQWTIVSLRGTTDLKDVLLDLDVPLVRPPMNWPDVGLHQGFLGAVEAVWPQVEAALKIIGARGLLPLLVTGHSLGGALASILGVRCASLGYVSPKVITFGSPRVGDEAFAATFNLVCPDGSRICHENDIVPHFPLYASFYRHVGGGHTLSDDGTLTPRGEGADIGSVAALLADPAGAVANHALDRYMAALARLG